MAIGILELDFHQPTDSEERANDFQSSRFRYFGISPFSLFSTRTFPIVNKDHMFIGGCAATQAMNSIRIVNASS